MLSSEEFERSRRDNVEERRAFIKRWAEFVRTHDDEEWSRQQNRLIDSQLQSANELARRGETDPVRFIEARDNRRSDVDTS
jgi:hypothetical protein